MLHNLLEKWVAVTPPQAIVDNASWTTASIDTKGFEYLDVFVQLGAMDIAMAAFKLQMSDTDGSYADVSGADFSVSPATLPSATADNGLYCIHVNLIGKKRFFDLVITGGDGSAGTFASAMARLTRAKDGPDSASDRGFAQELFA